MPKLLPLVRSQPAVLSENSQRLLARWITLKCMVLEHGTSPNVSDDVVSSLQDREYLKNYGKPPDGWQIWIGRHVSKRWNVATKRDASLLVDQISPLPDDRTEGKNIQTLLIGLGGLAIFVLSQKAPNISFKAEQGFKKWLVPLWPYEAGFLWPCTPVLRDAAMDQIAGSLEVALRRDVAVYPSS